jgi:hypothetical protein
MWIFFLVISCKKDSECSAIITVTDENSNAISGATVRLYYTETNSSGVVGNIDETKTTGGNGEAKFTFDLEAILFIEASKDTLTGTGIIKLVPGETAEETVVIKY